MCNLNYSIEVKNLAAPRLRIGIHHRRAEGTEKKKVAGENNTQQRKIYQGRETKEKCG